METREFDKYKDCFRCHRFIDEDTVKLKRIVTNDGGKWEKYCNDCITGNPVVRDVWYGYGSGTHTEENICDPQTGQPIPFSSRAEKYAAMQRAGVVEVGDRVHGARTTFTGK